MMKEIDEFRKKTGIPPPKRKGLFLSLILIDMCDTMKVDSG